tara:strand:- start:135 stop:581 length:447 start_codon:yes stop_codon:yes gene_type:complete
MSKTISFRNMLADDGQDRIKLTTLKGKKGYRIVKFELMPEKPGAVTQESVVKVYKKEQSSVDGVIDFGDQTILASASYIISDNTGQIWDTSTTIVFENEMFNQDIFITHKDVSTGQSVNYYLELEVMDISDLQATQLTLKSLRNIASR